MNYNFTAAVSALDKLKTGEINSIEGKPVDVIYRVQGSHTKKTRNYYWSTTQMQMKTELWKQWYSLCTWLVVHQLHCVGNGCNYFFFSPIIQVRVEKHVDCIFEQLRFISEPSFTFCYQLYSCSCLPQLCRGPSFNPTFPLQLPSLVQLVIDFLLSLYTNQLF